MTRRASCSCGRLHLTIEGEPSRIAMCHCLECQRRTGAVIGNQARFRREQVSIAGKSTEWMRTAESGNAMTYHFCPTCGSTVYWENEGFPEAVERGWEQEVKSRSQYQTASEVVHAMCATSERR